MKHRPERHPKGWGYEDWICNNDKFCGKVLFFEKGKKCSWHYHKIKEEVFYIQSGRVLVRFGYGDDINKSENIILEKGDCFHVKIGLRHQMEAIEETELIEFSTKHYEEDSHRIIAGD